MNTQRIPKKNALRKLGSATKRSERFLCQFGATLKKFFPRFQDWLEDISDPRQEAKCSYSLAALLWVSLLAMLSGQESRNQLNENLSTQETKTITVSLWQKISSGPRWFVSERAYFEDL